MGFVSLNRYVDEEMKISICARVGYVSSSYE